MSKCSPLASFISPDINRLILDIYEASVLLDVEQYRRWALEQLRRRIDLGHAAWGSGSPGSNRIHNLVQVGEAQQCSPPSQDALSLSDWISDADNSHPRVDWQSTTNRKLTHVVLERDPSSGLVRFISLTTKSSAGFTQPDRVLLDMLVPHVLSGWLQCQSFYLLRRRAHSKHGSGAIIDGEGWVQCADSKFFGLLRMSSANATHCLPTALRSLALSRRGEATFGGVRWYADTIDDLTYLTGLPLGPVSQLTSREQTIVTMIVAGHSYAQSAADLGISANTVRNTLVRVYRKLGVRNKLELAQRAGSPRSPANSDSFELR
jgi:DNA-binding CsgD family transcriptional regulator